MVQWLVNFLFIPFFHTSEFRKFGSYPMGDKIEQYSWLEILG